MIPTFNDRPSLIAAADLNGFRAVRVDGNGQLEYCGADEVPHGVLAEAPVATGYAGAFLPWTLAAQFVGIAAGAIAVGAECYTAANGKFDDSGSGPVRCIALTAAAGDGDQITLLKVENDFEPVSE